jgi:hypothetical protein
VLLGALIKIKLFDESIHSIVQSIWCYWFCNNKHNSFTKALSKCNCSSKIIKYNYYTYSCDHFITQHNCCLINKSWIKLEYCTDPFNCDSYKCSFIDSCSLSFLRLQKVQDLYENPRNEKRNRILHFDAKK